MEEVLKRLLTAEMSAEARVEQADETRKQAIQQALDEVRRTEADFERQAEARRTPFLTSAEEGAQRRISEMQEAAVVYQRLLREQAVSHEVAAVDKVLALMLGENLL